MHSSNIRKHYGKWLVLVLSLALVTGCATSEMEEPVPDADKSGAQASKDLISEEEQQEESRASYYDALHLEMEAVATQISQRLEMEGRHLSQSQYIEILKSFRTEEIQYMYLGFDDGTFISTPEVELPSTYDVVERDWYKKALENSTYTDIYQDAMTQTYICTMSVQVYDEKEAPVVLGIDYTLEADPVYFEDVEAYKALSTSDEGLESKQKIQSQAGDNLLLNTPGVDQEVNTFSKAQIESWTEVLHAVENELAPYETAQDIQAVLSKFVGEHDEVITFYLATPDGRLIASEDMELPEGYDPRERPWYEKTLNSDGVYISEPYYDILTENMIHSLFLELSSAPEAGWVLGIDVTN